MAIGFVELAQQCAPMMNAEKLAAIVSVESNFNPLNIRIYTSEVAAPPPKTRTEAVAFISALRCRGEDADLGLGGLSLQALDELGLSVSDAFDPCRNLAATGRLIESYYAAARLEGSDAPEQVSLWSYSGRGDPEPGRITGYDKLIEQQQSKLRYQLKSLSIATDAAPSITVGHGNDVALTSVAVRDPHLPPVVVKQVPDPELPSASSILKAQDEGPARQWDVFSASHNSQTFIFNK
ncbi:hypothetical protein [Brucella pseudogrignonensis]|uniref:hypothetical protein n=1 Tax=Brucella pseudogrignonensis TaxID=419475 RepID=UPI0038D1DBA9